MQIWSRAVLLSICNIDLFDIGMDRRACSCHLRLRFHPVDDLGQKLHARLRLSFHQEDDTLCEDFVVLKLLLSQV